jgi:hypothetical protein
MQLTELLAELAMVLVEEVLAELAMVLVEELLAEPLMAKEVRQEGPQEILSQC